MKKINNKKGFTLLEMLFGLSILVILMAPLPKMIATIIDYQIKEESKNISDINEMFNEIERDFLYISGHQLDNDNNGFDGNENFNYSLDSIKNYKDDWGVATGKDYFYYPITNKTMKIKTFYGCQITYSYSVDRTTGLGTFKKTVNVTPSGANCGREISVTKIKNLEFNKINNLVVFDIKITKDWDKSNNFTQFIKIRPFM